VRVIANLVNNALDALVARDDRRIGFSAEVGEFEVRMRVADNGPGLSASARERLFQPFFSTKPAGQGLGLGLAMSREVMREMGGELDVGGAESGGAVFDLTLPRAEVPPAGPAPGRE
jgi:C4-dicarboxylate-specific signal transduction histidine kinase